MLLFFLPWYSLAGNGSYEQMRQEAGRIFYSAGGALWRKARGCGEGTGLGLLTAFSDRIQHNMKLKWRGTHISLYAKLSFPDTHSFTKTPVTRLGSHFLKHTDVFSKGNSYM
jgi:hypothetical protein